MKRPEIIEAIRETLKRVAPNAQVILYDTFYLSNNDKSMLFTITYMLEIIICNDN